jgi:hypothetical protein
VRWDAIFATLGVLAITVAWMPWSLPAALLLVAIWRKS